MDIIPIIDTFNTTRQISLHDIKQLLTDNDARLNLCNNLVSIKNHDFAKTLLNEIIELRKSETNDIGMEDLMYACYLVTLHQDINDSLLIWKAKTVDFDSYCGVDIQLVVFIGVKETVSFLATQKDDNAIKALEYVTECNNSGDFENLEEYFSATNLPWWV